jgi:hypothetical protein
MNKRIAVALAAVASVSIIVAVIWFFPVSEKQPSTYPTPSPKGGEYLHFLNDSQEGGETRVFLIDSRLYYGVYNESFTRSGAAGVYSVSKGDPCVFINGTVRNEYDRDYYFCVTTEAHNSTGAKIGPILTVNSPQPGFTAAEVNSNSTGAFAIQIRYAGEDVVDYELFLAFEPSEVPPP